MHASSPVANVKQQLRELLRCAVASLSVYGADGALLPDTMSLSELGFSSGCRLYCRILAEEPAPLTADAAAGLGAFVPNGFPADIRELIRKADAAFHGRVGSSEAVPTQGKRSRDSGYNRGAGCRKATRGLFAGMRRGFLSFRGPAAATAGGPPSAPAAAEGAESSGSDQLARP